MKRMILGNTGIDAVRLGFGGIPIQRVSETQAIEVVLYALDKGIDFIDTSRVYTNSEGRIGKALKETDKKVAVATKSFHRSADGIRKPDSIASTLSNSWVNRTSASSPCFWTERRMS